MSIGVGATAQGVALAALLVCVAPAQLRALDSVAGTAGPVSGLAPAPAPYTGLDLVTGSDYAPYTGDDLPAGGLVTELVRRAFAVGGRRYDVRFMPWKRGYDGVVAGRFLATFPYIRTPEREREVLFSDPVLEVRQLVYLSNGSGMDFHGRKGGLDTDRDGAAERGDSDPLEDFRGRTVCQPVGHALPVELEAMVAQGRLTRQTPSDLGACVRMVATGRADALVTDEFSGAAAIAKSGLADDIRVSERPFAMVTLHLVVGRATPGAEATVAAFNDGLRSLKRQGVYSQLLISHTVQPPP
ncbi:amino acid ABC transporter substrate-binding protein [Azospirillum sp. TSH100]|uniref:substrate-binding periplasmic protein n=1 Tax=Azospirillum sp. TSH100 TaxID=652764 RepID=UPI000D607934|nr:transporter substrate-binding domain-containing protein [Azospirillum sp. TSH100]PWC85760.1 amino acid ABC transporter substrate-binding protein [Azospirillum sp. TSH100]QCG87810.1 transporter substrate-binding domain-containing protein [Azospirillum sp. TSH100]